MRRIRRALAIIALVGAAGACGDDTTGPGSLAGPTGVAVAQLSLTSVRVSWNAVTDAESYRVERASAADPGTFTQVGGTITGTTFDDTGLTTGVAYSYRVAGVAGGVAGTFSAAVSVTTGVAAGTIEGNITANRTLYTDTLYTLKGYVKVQSGATLTVQPGTRIVGDTATFGSSLWILRGAKLMAEGTADAPIVFTSQRSLGNRKPGDWGGIVIVGNGIINRTGTILTEGPAGIAENYAGGANNADNSGSLRYVRIEFAGFDVSGGGNSELNGLSMYAVGSGTTIECVQVTAGLDDSFEWWGGAVDGRYLISYEAGDDHFDTSEGYIGRNQFLIGFQESRLPPAAGTGVLASDPQGFEMDGCSGSGCANGQRSTPIADPLFANFTMVGSGNVETTSSGGFGAVIRRGTALVFHNGIIARWKGTAITIRDSVTNNLDSVRINNMILAENGKHYDDATADAAGPFGQEARFASANHRTAATAASIITSLNPASLDWTPLDIATSGGGVVALPSSRTGGFFGGTMENTTYVGAVSPTGPKWYEGWSTYLAN